MTLASLLTATLLALTPSAGAVSSAVPVYSSQSEPYALISQVDQATWAVDATLVEIYTSDLKAAGVLARAVPHRDADGQRDGFLLLEVVQGSPLHQAGFRLGDVVHSVDNRRLGGPVRALLVMHELRGADAVDVKITREGRTLELHYVVRRG